MLSLPIAPLPHPLRHMWRERLRSLRDRLRGRKGKQQNSIVLNLPQPIAYHKSPTDSHFPAESPQTPSFDALPSSPFAHAHDFNVESLLAFEAKTLQYNVFQGHPTASGKLLRS